MRDYTQAPLELSYVHCICCLIPVNFLCLSKCLNCSSVQPLSAPPHRAAAGICTRFPFAATFSLQVKPPAVTFYALFACATERSLACNHLLCTYIAYSCNHLLCAYIAYSCLYLSRFRLIFSRSELDDSSAKACVVRPAYRMLR